MESCTLLDLSTGIKFALLIQFGVNIIAIILYFLLFKQIRKVLDVLDLFY